MGGGLDDGLGVRGISDGGGLSMAVRAKIKRKKTISKLCDWIFETRQLIRRQWITLTNGFDDFDWWCDGTSMWWRCGCRRIQLRRWRWWRQECPSIAALIYARIGTGWRCSIFDWTPRFGQLDRSKCDQTIETRADAILPMWLIVAVINAYQTWTKAHILLILIKYINRMAVNFG